MSVHALMIVQEAFRKRRENVPDIHCAHGQLDSLEEEIVDQIRRECIEIPDVCPDCEVTEGEHAKWCNRPSLNEGPNCAFCDTPASWEGWCRVRDAFNSGRATGLIRRAVVCNEHRDRLSDKNNPNPQIVCTGDAARGGV